MTLRHQSIFFGALCTVASSAWTQTGCQTAAPSGGPGWQEVRQSLEQRVLESPASSQARLTLAQYLIYCDATRREGILQLLQIAKDRNVGAAALESWRQALAWVESDATSAPLFQAYLRLRPDDREIRTQLAGLEKGALLPGNRSGRSLMPASAPVLSMAPQPLGQPLPQGGAVPALQPSGPAAAAVALEPYAASAAAPAAAPAVAPSVSPWSVTPTPTSPPGATEAAAGARVVQAAPTPGSLQAQVAELRANIRDIEQSRTPEFSVGTVVRSRQGESGMSRLTATEVPMEMKFGFGDGKLSLRLTPVLLNAGTPATTYDVLSRFGGGPVGALADTTTSAGSQNDAGLGVGVAYQAGNWQADIGSTPLGFGKTDFNAGVSLRQPLGEEFSLNLGLSRRPVRDSLLSFAGARDKRSGVAWGGVSASGGRVGLTWDDGNIGVYGYGAMHRLTGSYVVSNTKAELGGGVYQHFVRDADRSLTGGVSLTAIKYDKNLRYFTFGHGGYFSPQEFVAVALPVEWQARAGRLRYHLKGNIGMQYIREDDAPFFPASASRQAAAVQAATDAEATGMTSSKELAVYSGQRKTGVGYGFSGAVEYQLQPQLWLGGHLGFDNARNFRQYNGGVYLRYAFEPFNKPLGLPLTPLRSPYDYE